jgi:hypothetical protein
MKKLLSIAAAGLFLLGQSGLVNAETYTLSATVPSATSVGFTVTRVDTSTTPNTRSAVSGSALSFGTLHLVTNTDGSSLFLPNNYFVIDVAAVGGAGSTDVTLAYTEGSNPNSPGHGLGYKSVATLVKVSGSGSSQTEAVTAHGKKKLIDFATAAEHVTPAELAGGFLRIYTGIVTKDPAAVPLDPATSEVFSLGDKPGTYSGSLVITATVS